MGGGYAVFVMTAAGVLIGQGRDQNVLRLLDQVFAEPGLIPVCVQHRPASDESYGLALAYVVALVGCAVGCSGVVGLPTFLHVTALARVGAAVGIHPPPWRSMSSATREWPDRGV
jgi:hypothetical protein